MLVSMIIPIYKGEKYMQPILDMAQANCKRLAEGDSMEVLFVNDYPETPLPTAIAEQASIPVRILENPQNLGIHGARVEGLKEAKGDYILFLDQDDTITDDCVASHLQVIGQYDVSVGNGYKMLGDQVKPIYRSPAKQKLATHCKYYLRAACQIVSPGHCLIRKEAIPQEWYHQIVTNNGSDDLFLWLLMFGHNASFTVNPARVYTHVDTGKNVSSDKMTMIRSSYNVVELLKQCPQIPARYARLYNRRIRFLEALTTGSKLKKLWSCICHFDICLCKLYAYYR